MRARSIATAAFAVLVPLTMSAIPWPATAVAAVHGVRPHIKAGTPYPDARAELIRQGFDPVRIVAWQDGDYWRCVDVAWPDVCAVYPEVMSCAGDAPLCEFLFRRRADGRYWMVGVRGEPAAATRKAMRALRYQGGGPMPNSYWGGLVVLKPDGRRFRFRDAPGKPP